MVKPFFVRPSFKQLKDWKRKEEIIRQNIELHSHQFKSSKEKKIFRLLYLQLLSYDKTVEAKQLSETGCLKAFYFFTCFKQNIFIIIFFDCFDKMVAKLPIYFVLLCKIYITKLSYLILFRFCFRQHFFMMFEI